MSSSSSAPYSFFATMSVACNDSTDFYPIGPGQDFLCQNGTMFTQAEYPITASSITNGDAVRCHNASYFYPISEGQNFFCLNATLLVQAEATSTKSGAFKSSVTCFQCLVAILAMVCVMAM